jgi:hypothetical protein
MALVGHVSFLAVPDIAESPPDCILYGAELPILSCAPRVAEARNIIKQKEGSVIFCHGRKAQGQGKQGRGGAPEER